MRCRGRSWSPWIIVGVTLNCIGFVGSLTQFSLGRKAIKSALKSSNGDNGAASFLSTITDWLDHEDGVRWCHEETLFPQSSCAILRVSSSSQPERAVLLHLLPSPRSQEECLSPTFTRDFFALQNDVSLPFIHLHQDVWTAKHDIVKSRLKMRLGKFRSRIFARKTKVKRIDAATALPFLNDHHLWSAVKSKYYYGLFYACGEDKKAKDIGNLVAVASFSARRKVLRGGVVHRSHELIRFCAERDGMVVGGITKLVKAFVVDQQPDDIVTVVDRDWGSGEGWHSIGFETVHVMPPLVMAISRNDGMRRHLVGAGIKPKSCANNGTKGRLGVEQHVLDALDELYSDNEAKNCLDKHGYFPVYDAGVERLLMIVPKYGHPPLPRAAVVSLWGSSVPTYASTYYSENAGINVMLGHAKESSDRSDKSSSALEQVSTSPRDSDMAKQCIADWKGTGGSAKAAKVLFSTPSSLDPKATVEIRRRPGGWCTLGIVGGRTKSIYHGMYKVREDNGEIEPSELCSEHLRTMASCALTVQVHSPNNPLSMLYFGYGAGSLSRFMAHAVPNSDHVVIELDRGVLKAARECNLLSLSQKEELLLGNAMHYQQSSRQNRFQCLFVDIFDGDNILPPDFYSKTFLEEIRRDLLCKDRGVVVHNFHTGNRKLHAQLKDASESYQEVFPAVALVESLDSRRHAGNTILVASVVENGLDVEHLRLAAAQARQSWNVNFDLSARVSHNLRPARSLSVPSDTVTI